MKMCVNWHVSLKLRLNPPELEDKEEHSMKIALYWKAQDINTGLN
jgi:hypothetical protein